MDPLEAAVVANFAAGVEVSKLGAATVSRAEILAAYRFLAREEGVFCEPASAAPVAGLFKLARAGRAPKGLTVCVLTGHGLKDPGITARFKPKVRRVKAGGAIKL